MIKLEGCLFHAAGGQTKQLHTGQETCPACHQKNPTAETAAAATDETARVHHVQLALKAAGFDPGSSDGKLGPRTKAAVRDFQQANGLNPDGKVGSRTWSKLEPYLKTAQAATLVTQGQGD